MKKIDIIQTTILVIAIMIGYSGVTSLLSTIPYLTAYGSTYSDFAELIALSLLVTGMLFAASFFLIRYSHWAAERILRADKGHIAEDTARFDLDRRTAIYVLFIGIGSYMLAQALAAALADIIDLVSFRNSGGSMSILSGTFVAKRNKLIVELLRVAIGACLIYAAPTLTDFIEKNIGVRLKTHTPGTRTPEIPGTALQGDPDTQST